MLPQAGDLLFAYAVDLVSNFLKNVSRFHFSLNLHHSKFVGFQPAIGCGRAWDSGQVQSVPGPSIRGRIFGEWISTLLCRSADQCCNVPGILSSSKG